MWPLGSTECGCYVDPNDNTVQNRYRCSKANEQYKDLISQFIQDPPLELHIIPNQDRCDTWNETSFDSDLFGMTPPVGYMRTSEIMTNVFEPNVEQPLTVVTIAALDDMSIYPALDYTKADPWPVPYEKRRRRSLVPLDSNDPNESNNNNSTVNTDNDNVATSNLGITPSKYFDISDAIEILNDSFDISTLRNETLLTDDAPGESAAPILPVSVCSYLGWALAGLTATSVWI